MKSAPDHGGDLAGHGQSLGDNGCTGEPAIYLVWFSTSGLLGFDADAFMADVERRSRPEHELMYTFATQTSEKSGDHVTAPIVIQHGEPSDEEHRDRDVSG